MNSLSPRGGLREQLRRRAAGEYIVDAWGLDPEVHDASVRALRVRWNVTVEGVEHIPTSGPALLLVQRRVGLSELAVVATGIRSATERRVRSGGVPGVTWFEAALRRAGAVFAHPDEIAGLLRDEHVVALGLRPTPLGGRPGAVDPALVIPALAQDVPILPVAAHGNEFAHRWTVEIGAPIELPHVGGRIAAVEHVERARDEIASMRRGGN